MKQNNKNFNLVKSITNQSFQRLSNATGEDTKKTWQNLPEKHWHHLVVKLETAVWAAVNSILILKEVIDPQTRVIFSTADLLPEFYDQPCKFTIAD